MTDAQKEDYLATLNQTGALSAAYLTAGTAIETKLDTITDEILTAFGKDIETTDNTDTGDNAADAGETVDNVNNNTVDGEGIDAPKDDSSGEDQTEEQISWWKAMWQAIGNWFSNLFSSIWNAITGFFSGIWNWLVTNIFQPIGNFFSSIWNGIVNAAKWVWDMIKKGLIDPIVKFFTMPTDEFNQMWANMG
jgi:hypothetical protein